MKKRTAQNTHRPMRHLPPESWGRRLARARAEVGNLTVYSAAEAASPYWPATHATIGRIENLADAPSRWDNGASRRALAYVLCRIYGVYPSDWGALQVGDIDLAGRFVHVRGKGGHERVVALVDEVMGPLADYLAEAPAKAGPLIRSHLDEVSPILPGTVGVTVHRIMRSAGMSGSCHCFRHTCASDVADRVGDLRVVQEMLGHRSIATTQIYAPRARLVDMHRAMAGRNYTAA